MSDRIPVVRGRSVILEDSAFELESPEGARWLKSPTTKSFRYESVCGHEPFTAAKKTARGIDYWYASKKVVGKLRQKYIGRAGDLTQKKLEEVAEILTAIALRDRKGAVVYSDSFEERLQAVEVLLERIDKQNQVILGLLKKEARN